MKANDQCFPTMPFVILYVKNATWKVCAGRTMLLTCEIEKRRYRPLTGQNSFANENLRPSFSVSVSQYVCNKRWF